MRSDELSVEMLICIFHTSSLAVFCKLCGTFSILLTDFLFSSLCLRLMFCDESQQISTVIAESQQISTVIAWILSDATCFAFTHPTIKCQLLCEQHTAHMIRKLEA